MISKIIPLLLCPYLFVVYATNVNYCWEGSSEDFINRRNLSCATGTTSLSDALSSRVLPSHSNTAEDHRPSMAASTQSYHCMAFKRVRMIDDGLGAMVTTSEMSYTCDSSHVCVGKDMRSGYKIMYKGHNGTLYCCDDKNNCNDPGIINHRHTCYNTVSNTQSHRPPVREEVCGHEQTLCIRRRVMRAGTDDEADTTVSEEFQCDKKGECALLDPDNFIKHSCVIHPGNVTSTELCCCHGDNCFEPDWSAEKPGGVPGEAKQDPSRYNSSWQRILLIVLGTALGLIVAFVALFYIRRGIQNAKKAESPKPLDRMVYRSITSDDDDGDNVQILP